ncbi:MAG: NAD(P)/FAD-dependent oxidoreductase, partial [Candidatus Latescibacterota bacterium]
MSDVLIVGDGPAGLSAALFLAKNEMSVKVFGQDQTLMHKAMVYNYLGIPEITGSEFQKIGRQQVEKFGAELLGREVSGVEKGEGSFTVHTDDGARH